MTKQKTQYSFMYYLKLLNKQYTNHIHLPNEQNSEQKILDILNMFHTYKISKTILLNNTNEKIIVWKTCDFADKNRMETINCETEINKQLKELGYDIEHNYRIFMIRNYNVCITTYHDLTHIFNYSAAMIVLKPKMLNQDGIIFMNKNHINAYFGYMRKDPEFIEMMKNNYQYITLVDEIHLYFCFKNKKLVKQYIILDDFLHVDKINALLNYMQNACPRTKEKNYCMYELTYIITVLSDEEIIQKIGEETFHRIKQLCNYKIDERFVNISTHYIQRN